MVANNIDAKYLAVVAQLWQLLFPAYWVVPEYVPRPTIAATHAPESASGSGENSDQPIFHPPTNHCSTPGKMLELL
jgi:hypothetical protein